jgi:hypothetical protein
VGDPPALRGPEVRPSDMLRPWCPPPPPHESPGIRTSGEGEAPPANEFLLPVAWWRTELRPRSDPPPPPEGVVAAANPWLMAETEPRPRGRVDTLLACTGQVREGGREGHQVRSGCVGGLDARGHDAHQRPQNLTGSLSAVPL